jgi:DNA polymerase-3 subunit delta'
MTDTQSNIAPWINEQVQNLFSSKGHAWLFQGPSGLGQYQLAIEISKAWLCLEPIHNHACNRCQSCHLVEVHTHPDLYVLMPEVQMLDFEWPLSEKAQKEIDDKDRKPSKEIRVEAVRDMVEFTQRTSTGSKAKIVLIYPAEKLNLYASNMILKTLEEPPGNSRFIVSSEASYQLLPTIRSRCQTHTLSWPTESAAIQWMIERGIEQSEASALLKASGGRPEDALNLASLGIDEPLWNSIPKAIFKGDMTTLEGLTPTQVIKIFQKLCSDLIANHFGANTRYFKDSTLPKSKNILALSNWYKELCKESKTSEHPFNAGLMIESLCIQAERAMRD